MGEQPEHRLGRWCHGDTGSSFEVVPWVYFVRAVVFGAGALAGLVGVLCAFGWAFWRLPVRNLAADALTLWVMWVPFMGFALLMVQPSRIPRRLRRHLK